MQVLLLFCKQCTGLQMLPHEFKDARKILGPGQRARPVKQVAVEGKHQPEEQQQRAEDPHQARAGVQRVHLREPQHVAPLCAAASPALP